MLRVFKTTFKYNIFSAGEAIVTGAGDETLRFWNVFSKARSQKVISLMFFFHVVILTSFSIIQESKSALNLFTSIR